MPEIERDIVRVARERVDLALARGEKRRAQQKIFRRIAADRELRKRDQRRAIGARGVGKLAHARGVCRDGAHGKVHLGERELEGRHSARSRLEETALRAAMEPADDEAATEL